MMMNLNKTSRQREFQYYYLPRYIDWVYKYSKNSIAVPLSGIELKFNKPYYICKIIFVWGKLISVIFPEISQLCSIIWTVVEKKRISRQTSISRLAVDYSLVERKTNSQKAF